ncbi:MAG TPA: hypothetical protein VGC42_11690 [Kofleriaceae bacterium]
MSSRVAGAALALIAAALLAVSIATPAVLPPALSLFAGTPTVDGHARKSQNMYVGLYNAQLCNNGDSAGEDRGGEMVCKTGDSQGAFHFISFGELGASGLGVIAALALAVVTLRRRDSRKGWAKLVRLTSVVGVAGAVGLIATHPVGASAAVPIGLGMVLHVIGLTCGLAASVIAVRPPRPIQLRSRPAAAQPPPPAIDMDKLFHEEPPRPQAFGPNAGSWPGHAPPPPQQQHHQPPPQQQLRPLYDATPMQGGTGGLMPFERPVLPHRAPTPVPRATFEVDIDVEPSMVAPMPQPMQARTKPSTLPPPMPGSRSKQITAPPPMPGTRPPLPFAPAPSAMAMPAYAPPPAVAEPAMFSPFPDEQVVRVSPISESLGIVEPPSSGAPDAPVSSPNTEPTVLPAEPDPQGADAAPEPLEAPPPLRAKSPSSSGSVPAIPSAPIPAVPSVRPQRDTRQPIRASVPLPARASRPTMPTRPPPLRAAMAKSTIASPVVPPPAIPAIPGIPTVPTMPSFALPPVTAQQRAATQIVPELAAARVPVEITDNASQTNISGVPSDSTGQIALEDAAYMEAEGLAGEPSDTAQAAAVRPSDTSPSGELLAAQPPPVAFPVPTTMAPPTASRATPRLPITTAPDTLPPPRDNKPQASGPSPACPQCEAPMAWVEEHLRFYCKSCRMYF